VYGSDCDAPCGRFALSSHVRKSLLERVVVRDRCDLGLIQETLSTCLSLSVCTYPCGML